jgi:hypothetical protein
MNKRNLPKLLKRKAFEYFVYRRYSHHLTLETLTKDTKTSLFVLLSSTSRFWQRVRARALSAPSFWAHKHVKRGAARPRQLQLCCILFVPQK